MQATSCEGFGLLKPMPCCALCCAAAENGLTGTKLGCGEGGCGACTVMLSHWEEGSSRVVHRSANACLCPLYAVDGMHVVTVEGIGNVRDGLHPVQKRLAETHGSQCGFCTPGFVMSMYSLLRSCTEPPTMEDIEECISGNLWYVYGTQPTALSCDSAMHVQAAMVVCTMAMIACCSY